MKLFGYTIIKNKTLKAFSAEFEGLKESHRLAAEKLVYLENKIAHYQEIVGTNSKISWEWGAWK